MIDHKVPLGSVGDLSTAFCRPGQDSVLRAFAESYREALPRLHEQGMMVAMALAGAMFPRFGADAETAATLEAAAADPSVSPVVAKRVAESVDQLQRMLASRARPS